jgi:cytosine/adenosine deaminase-related metal-dependent hydrolase
LRYLTADFVFPISQQPIKNGIVTIDDTGKILKVNGPHPSILNLEYFKGILCPGFINTHCHLELSHMKDVIPEKTGLAGFIKHFIAARKSFSPEQIKNGIAAGEKEMLENGIVAVGDICNLADTFNQKAKKNLKYYSFIEGFDFFPEQFSAEFARMQIVAEKLKEISPEAKYNFVPHAPYSVSELLFKIIRDIEGTQEKIISMHNQESAEENLLFLEKQGEIIEFFTSLEMDFSHWKASGKSSLQTVLGYFPKENNVLLVHNTFTNEEDMKFAEAYSKNIYWVSCPNANLYIENRLPDYNLFIEAGAKMTIGTDSLASNYSLSILDELKTISFRFPELKLETLLQWATLNGAKALGFQHEVGSFEVGKKPGVLLIEHISLDNLSLTCESKVKRLI